MGKFKIYDYIKSKRYSHNEKYQGKIVKFGEDNLFPQHLAWLYNHSSVNGACIQAKTDATIGNGLTSDIDGALDTANPMESWNDIFKKVAQDINLYGGFALEVIWSKDRTKIAQVYHVDFGYVRAGEMDYAGRIPCYYVSSCWGDTNYNTDPDNSDYIKHIPAYNPATALEEPKQLYVCRPYRPNLEYYPLPDYVGGLRVIELDTEVDNFHVNNLKNGLAPSLAITTFANASPEEQEWIEKALRAQYGGTDNAGSLLYMDVESPEQAPQITPINTNGNDTYYETLNEMIQQKILTAHRITSPMILGIKTEGQLGGRDEMLDAYLLFMNSVINPIQQTILDSFESLLEVNYDDITLGVTTTQLFDDGAVETDVVVSSESSEGDAKDLEQEEDSQL